MGWGVGAQGRHSTSPLFWSTAVSPFYRPGAWLPEARDLPRVTRGGPGAVTQMQIGLAAGPTLFISVALVPASVSPVLRELQTSSRPCAPQRGCCLLTLPQHPRDGEMDAGPMGGRCDMPTHPRTAPQLMELLLGGAAPSGQVPRHADEWATRPTTHTLTAVLQGQQGTSTVPHSVVQQTQAGEPNVCWNTAEK